MARYWTLARKMTYFPKTFLCFRVKVEVRVTVTELPVHLNSFSVKRPFGQVYKIRMVSYTFTFMG